jgi:hypothetical protein
VLVVLIAWELMAHSGLVHRGLMPDLASIGAAVLRGIANGDLAYHSAVTVGRALFGFATGAIAGIVLGALMARSGRFEAADRARQFVVQDDAACVEPFSDKTQKIVGEIPEHHHIGRGAGLKSDHHNASFPEHVFACVGFSARVFRTRIRYVSHPFYVMA